jgi:DNA topoisomerase I
MRIDRPPVRSATVRRLTRAHPRRSAAAAGLRYRPEGGSGLRRIGSGKGFRYVDDAGRPVRSPATLARIRALAIPPAWREVWIAPDAQGHVQATGRDARGRKQYRYHAAFSAVRNETKFERMLEFGGALPRIRAQIERDVASPGLPQRKVLAVIVRLLERSLIRVGCAEYARTNDAYGLATLRDRHVRIEGAALRFRFRGKGGKRQEVVVSDRRLARIVKRCMDLPGCELFQYVDEAGAQQCVDSGEVNAYLRGVAGDGFTAKDFRTWGATLLAAEWLAAHPAPASVAARKRVLAEAFGRVSARLGNTPSVCRKYYVNPCVLEAWEADELPACAGPERGGLTGAERSLLALLRRARAPKRAAA